MDTMTVLAITACVLSAGIVYVMLKIDFSAKTQKLDDALLALQTESVKIKKSLKDCTHYNEYLVHIPNLVSDRLKAPAVKISREMTHAELVTKERHKLRDDVVVISKYQVEFGFTLDAGEMALKAHTNGLAIKLSRPLAVAEPVTKLIAQQVICASAIADDRALLAAIDSQFQSKVRALARGMAGSEEVLSLCRLKVTDAVRDVLIAQPGVRLVPAMFVDFK